jgi:DNA-binding IscR family transcriptional regulator
MNAQARLSIDACILGNGALQKRFAAYVEVLGYIVQRAPRPVDLVPMEAALNRPVAALRRSCNELCDAGILKKSPKQAHAWVLMKALNDVTLDDVFRCVIAGGSSDRKPDEQSGGQTGGEELALEVFLTQALLRVDAHLYKHLRTFSLDRLKASAAGTFPSQRALALQLFTEVENA